MQVYDTQKQAKANKHLVYFCTVTVEEKKLK
jgi:hypothetical protein